MPTETTPKRPRGRPETPEHLRRVDCNTRQPQWLVDWLEAQPQGKGSLIEAALIEAYKLKPPKT